MITKMILSAVLNTPANLENSPVAIGLEKVIFIPATKKGNPRESSNHHIIALLSQVSKAMLKILQARLQQFVNMEFPDVDTVFRKDRGTSDQIANIYWSTEKN